MSDDKTDQEHFDEAIKTSTFLGIARQFSLSATVTRGVPHITLLFQVREPDQTEERVSTCHLVYPVVDNAMAEQLIALGEHLAAAVRALQADGAIERREEAFKRRTIQ